MNKFIHHSIIVYFALIIVLRMMAMPLSLLDYSLNQRYIAEKLCENRLKSDMHCGGTCYLNKKLARSIENQEPTGQKGTIKNIVVDFFEPIKNPGFNCLTEAPVYAGQFMVNSLSNAFIGNIFHPPIS